MPEQRKMTAEIKRMPVDSKFSTVGVVTDFRDKRDKNGKPFWNIAIMDSQGILEAKIWSYAQWWDYREGTKKKIDKPEESSLLSNLKGCSVGINGLVSEFREKLQYNFTQIYIVDQEQDEYRPESFVQKTPISIDRLEERFRGLVNSCGGDLGNFLNFVFDENGEMWKAFRKMPAAVSHHHAYVHGLLEHTVGVASMARVMAGQYPDGPADIDVDMVTAGALLHDLGKIDAYALKPAPCMTVSGTVIDHVVMGYTRFLEFAGDFGLDDRLKLALGHIILSHHGQREYGSPVVPSTPEALIVSAADDLDFRLFCWSDAVNDLDGSVEDTGKSISDFNFSAQRRFWKWNGGE